MSAVCEKYGAYHFFSIPTGDDGYGRRCACGEPQVYRPPTGKPAEFTDVLVEADDLRDLLYYVEGPDYDPHGDFSSLMKRIHAALGE